MEEKAFELCRILTDGVRWLWKGPVAARNGRVQAKERKCERAGRVLGLMYGWVLLGIHRMILGGLCRAGTQVVRTNRALLLIHCPLNVSYIIPRYMGTF